MAGNNQRSHITGNGNQELQYLKFQNLSSNPVIETKGQFYYNTTNKVLRIFDSTWNTIPFFTGSMPSGDWIPVVANYGIKAITAPSVTSFYKVTASSNYTLSQYIEFTDINPAAYKTTITSPGVNTKLVTEKAVVDYIGEGISGVSYIGLTDTTDTNYTGKASAIPMVNDAEDALELVDSELATFDILDDTPLTKTGFGGYLVRVNLAETGLEYYNSPSTINTVSSSFLKLTFSSNNLTVAPYTSKIGSNPGYPYLYITDTSLPTYTNVLTLDGHLKATKLSIDTTTSNAIVAASTTSPAINASSSGSNAIVAMTTVDAYSALNAYILTVATNTIKKPLQISALTSGTPAVGLGAAMSFYLPRTTGGSYEAGFIATKVNVVTPTSETTSFELWLDSVGTLGKKLEITGSGSIDTVLGQYHYHSQTIGVDTAGDWRIFGNGTAFYTEYCTVGNSTRGAGTWIVKNTITI